MSTLHNIFTDQELLELEQHVNALSDERALNQLRPPTYHCTYKRCSNPNEDLPTRTKFFFGVARYLWGNTDPDPLPHVAAGIRTCDVNMARPWMRALELKLVRLGIIPPSFINQFAINIYHDGSEGLAQHFDDAKRFAQPIISLRLFSDSRLSFGSKYYYYHDSSFFVPMKRGAITILQPNSFAANKISHCVRAGDMEGKSAVIVLRHVKQDRIVESNALAVDRMSGHFHALNLHHNVPYVAKPIDHTSKKINAIVKKHLNRLIKKVIHLNNQDARKEQRRIEKVKKQREKEVRKVVDGLLDGVEGLQKCLKSRMLVTVGKIQHLRVQIGFSGV